MRRDYRSQASLLFGLALVTVLGCRATSLPLWRPRAPYAEACEVVKVRGLPYADGPEGKSSRHSLDLFVPRGKQNFPVVVLVHGGAWMVGDNRCCGLYSSVGEFLASQGIGTVLPNYRLSPKVKHPDHAKDVARAVAWTRAHIAEHGGSPDNIFLAGHSAGGHLVSLLATDETYLRAEGMRSADIKGVIAVSGVYRIDAGPLAFTLGGDAADAFRLDEVAPLRGSSSKRRASPWSGIPMSLDVFGPAFGDDPEVRQAASPLTHVRPGLPPFLILCAEKDLPTLAKMAEEFHKALVGQGCDARLLKIENRNHNSILFRAVEREDEVARAMVEFVRRHGER